MDDLLAGFFVCLGEALRLISLFHFGALVEAKKALFIHKHSVAGVLFLV
jgi:hypothetical protein